MWYSIKTVEKPSTLKEAVVSLKNIDTTLFSGGSYLVADKNPNIQSLIDINDLVGDGVIASIDGVHIDAGATLQTFLDIVYSINPECRLLKGIKLSCPSKQIRNQRTFGGEIGKGRSNSEVMVFLHAVNADLTVFTDTERSVSIRDWDGSGIVTKISYFPKRISGIELERFSLIESAPAIVIVSGVKRKNQFEFSVGGTTNKIQSFTCLIEDWSAEISKEFAGNAVKEFSADHLGSLDYKENLIATAVNRVGDAL